MRLSTYLLLNLAAFIGLFAARFGGASLEVLANIAVATPLTVVLGILIMGHYAVRR